MIAYVQSRWSWIAFFIIQLTLINVVIYVDSGIQLQKSALFYLDGIILLLFIAFFIWRYTKETKLIRSIETIIDTEMTDWHDQLPLPSTKEEEVLIEFIERAEREQRVKFMNYEKQHLLKADYIASWAHEVKAPLTSMKLTIDANRSVEAMRFIEQDWLRIHLLVDEQLSVARLGSLEADYVLAEQSMRQLVGRELKDLATLFFQKNIGVEIEGDDASVLVDEKWARFILRQLLTNAVKYSESDSIITIRLGAHGTIPFIRIEDEGRGIAEKDLPRIFEKGFTGMTGRKHNEATGLGLYLANEVSKKIGCTLRIESSEGEGTHATLAFSKPNAFDQLAK